MRMRSQSSFKQRGFSLLTAFILVIIMFGSLAFFLAGQGINSTFGTQYINLAKASGLLTSAGYVKAGFDAIILGGQKPDAVTFNQDAVTGVFNPTDGGAALQPLDPELFQTRAGAPGLLDGYWIYRKNDIKLNDVGDPTVTTGEYTMMVSGLKLTVCQQLNFILYGTPLTTSPTTLTAKLDADVIGSALNAPTKLLPFNAASVPADLSSLFTQRNMNGCYATATITNLVPNYVYIHTLLAQ